MSNSTAKSATPFGFEKGLKVEEVTCDIEEINFGIYVTSQPPKPHSSFSSYVLRIAPQSGLYWVKGISGDIETDSAGTMLKSRADNMIERLAKVYGPPERILFFNPGTIWGESEDFMMGMACNEIHYGASWSKEAHELPSGLGNIYFAINAKSSNTGYMIIEYEFDNHEQGEREVEEVEDGAL
ncbi:hypothetical protein HNO51_05095 [Billgrantia sulfidoxydans]|uniref:Uncharacterized protein n=1 Tax=Billgrantia sulfidoxydans TaxID=2733484 RepID=A0ABX7W1S7_9GAMM|nr:hypothetical protein [Halomonas sulfidoxydans]QTP54110.1 hypothetical protein HNO51_05095 [Halomonas sulfidoxydans]